MRRIPFPGNEQRHPLGATLTDDGRRADRDDHSTTRLSVQDDWGSQDENPSIFDMRGAALYNCLLEPAFELSVSVGSVRFPIRKKPDARG